MKKQKSPNTIIAIVAVAIVTLFSYYLYQQYNGPLPYEPDLDQVYEEQGLPGINFEYTGPDSENPPSGPSELTPSN